MAKSIFDKKNIPESNWFKFEKVGDKVAGTVVNIFEKPERDGFAAQKCFTLEQEDGSQVNVGLKKSSDYLMGRTNSVKVGDELGLEFKAEIPAKKKGYNPAKSIEVYHVKGTGVKYSDEQAKEDQYSAL